MKKLILLFSLLLFASTSCTPKDTVDEIQTLTVMTHDSFAVSEDVVEFFENQNHVQVQFLEVGDTGTALNKAIISRGNPLADIFYGVDNTFLSRALSEEIYEPYRSPVLDEIDPDFVIDKSYHALPVDFGDVCLNYQKSYFDERDLAPPNSLEDLIDPAYEDLLTVQNPATSSPGLAFLMTTIAYFGEDGYLDYWNSLVDNKVNIVNDWETAYYAAFSQAGGPDPIVVSYGSSPPFEVLFSEQPLEDAPTAAVVSPGTCFRQIEFVGILKGTENRDLAEKWIDYMLSPTFQEDIPLNMYVFPVNRNAALEETFQKYLQIPEITADIHPDQIAESREKWIIDWTEIVLR